MADDFDQRSAPTHGPTVSQRHRTRSMHGRNTTSTGTGGVIQGEALPLLPPSHPTPTPSGVPSRRGSPAVAARRASLPITPISPSDPISSITSSSNTHNTAMHPSVRPLPIPPTMSGSSAPHAALPAMAFSPLSPISPSNLSRNASYARSAAHKAPGMDPVPEDADADASEYAETTSLRQLPSPPASPDQPHVDGRRRGSSVSSSRHPSRQSALPSSYRPRSASTAPGVGLPLTAAFQTSVLRSGSGTSSTVPPRLFGHGQRYPSITTSSPPPRSRPSSVSASSATETALASSLAEENTTRTMESFRRMSTTDIRPAHRHPVSFSSRPSSPSAEEQARPFLRTSDVLPNPEATTSGTRPRSSSSHRHNQGPPSTTGVGVCASAIPSTLATSPPPAPLSPGCTPVAIPLTASTAPRLIVHTQPHPRPRGMSSAYPSAVSWKSLASGSRPSQASSHHSNAHTPVPRSRSNSVRSVTTLPPHMPAAFEALSPLSMDSPEDDDGVSRSGKQ